MKLLASKFKDVIMSVMPIVILVLILHFTIAPLETNLLISFLIGSLLVVFGLAIFLLGVDIGITPLGSMTGSSLAKSNKLWIVLIAGLILGFFISIAEPGLMVLAGQVDYVTSGQIPSVTILVLVSVGLAIMLSLGFLRVFYNVPLYKILIVLYLIIFAMAIFVSREFLAISFDASGATTGILAVPFILSLSLGISKLKKDSKASEKDSFGLVAIASTGAIMSLMILDLVMPASNYPSGLETDIVGSGSILEPFLKVLPGNLQDSVMAILPLLVILMVLQKVFFRLKKRELRKLLTGFVFAFIGLFVFLLGVNGGFMDVSTSIGEALALMDNKAYIIGIGFVLGLVTILAEPAVYVLTTQIEEVTSGYVKKSAVLTALSLGVGLAVAMSVIRILLPKLELWHYLLPGYIICLIMTLFIPKIFVGIAFDAGGVATGPMTATFILAFMQGAAFAFEGADLMRDGFGMIAMVAMMPIITLEFLGLLFLIKSKAKGAKKTDE